MSRSTSIIGFMDKSITPDVRAKSLDGTAPKDVPPSLVGQVGNLSYVLANASPLQLRDEIGDNRAADELS